MNRIPAAAATLLLLAALAPAQDGTPPAPAPAPAPADDKAVLEKLVEQAIPHVEKARGLKFTGPVPASPVTREGFVDRYKKEFDRILGGGDRVEPASRMLVRLGVLAEKTDLKSILSKFLEGNIAANYDPSTKGVSFLPGVPRTLQLMVHELTHALDDQHFDMSKQIESWKGQFDRMLAYGALCEGDAESVEYRFATQGGIAQQPLDSLRLMADAMATGILQGKFGATPPAVVLAFKSQYLEGAIFAEFLRRTKEGEEAVNKAFRDPPQSTEQVLHPEKFLAGEKPVEVTLAAPPEGAKVLFSTTLGELVSRILLQSRGAKNEEAAAAAAGWGGDTVALVAFPAGEALIWVSTWDTPKDAEEFLAAMKKAYGAAPTGEGKSLQRGIVLRGSSVEYVEAPLDCLADAVRMAAEATKK